MKMDSKSPAAFPREPSCTYPPGRCSFTCSARLRARTERAWHAGSARKAEPRSWSDEAGARTDAAGGVCGVAPGACELPEGQGC